MLAGEMDKSDSNLSRPIETGCHSGLKPLALESNLSLNFKEKLHLSPLFSFVRLYCLTNYSQTRLASCFLSFLSFKLHNNEAFLDVQARTDVRYHHHGSFGTVEVEQTRSAVPLSGGVLEISLVQDPGPICQRDAPTERKCWAQAGEPSAPP